MKKQVYNPYLPLDTYIPDGEPHVFGDRLYVFGSHDQEGGSGFCLLPYEVWSAPVDDLSDWTCHGASYRAEQDPTRDERHRDLYAPDVVRGNDGRYYLYYALAGKAFTGLIHVAVAETPEGPYEYYGELKNPDGTPFERNVTFDPGVINDNGTIRLYYGWGLAAPQMAGISGWKRKLMKPLLRIVEKKLFDKTSAQIKREPEGLQGAFTVTLADDMLTVTSEPKKIVPYQMDATGTDFEGHAFFEASSIRKIGETYYFIYSSEVNHELCYAASRFPDRDFRYGGVIVSNGDIGLNGRRPEDRLAMTGNNHGSIECVGGQWYIFYHRQTHKTSYSRQGCAEKITILPDGSIPQVEMTSCGLNDGPLKASGEYPAVIACNLTNGHMPHIDPRMKDLDIPAVTHQGEERYITGIKDKTTICYKYFAFHGKTELTLRCRARGNGVMTVKVGEKDVGSVGLHPSESWADYSLSFSAEGDIALILRYVGEGEAELLSICFA